MHRTASFSTCDLSDELLQNHSKNIRYFSASGNVMQLAAKELNASGHIKVSNSQNLPTSANLLVLEAAIMTLNGSNADEVVTRIEMLCPLVRA